MIMRFFSIYVFINFICISSFAQLDLKSPDITNPVEEGKILFKLECAAWIATDTLYAKYESYKSKVGGYLCYEASDTVKTIFWNKENSSEILVTFSFLKEFKSKIIDFKSRNVSSNEKYLINLKLNALKKIYKNENEDFTFYENTSFNLIPIIHKDEGIVYVLTATTDPEVVILGNDYIMKYNLKGDFKELDTYHKSLLRITKSNVMKNGLKIESVAHTHMKKYIITPTEVCTLLLYRKFIK